MPNVISDLLLTASATTIVATWTTSESSDSNLSCGGKAAIDNGVAPAGTSHQAIVAGLAPGTTYSCVVTSGGVSSTAQNVTTNGPEVRTLVTGAMNGPVSSAGNYGDTNRTFVSSDNKTYITQDDGYGFAATHNAGYATQLGVLTNESTFVGTPTGLTAYGALAEEDGTDGPSGDEMTNKSSGLFGMLGNLYMFVYRQYPPTYSSNRYGNIIKSEDKGASWNNFTAPADFVAGGNPVLPHSPSEPVQFYVNTIGLVTPVLYGVDDGTLGYNSAGNQIDGANGYVYCTFSEDVAGGPFLLRLPRIQLDAQNLTAAEYWVGPASPVPTDFTNDANWSGTPSGMTVIISGQAGGWVPITFLPALNSYIVTLTTAYNFAFYSAPTPAGPWTEFFSQTNSEAYYGPFPMHRDVAENALSANVKVRILYTGAGEAYATSWSTFTLNPVSQTQVVSYGFTTVEDPLSDGGNFSSGNSLEVPSSGVCHPTASSTYAGTQWTGAIDAPSGAWPADHYVELTIGALSDGYSLWGEVRFTSAGNGYQFYLTSSEPNTVYLYRQADYSGTLLVSQTGITLSPGDVWRLSVIGTVLTLSQNGIVVATATDSTYASGGAPGVQMYNTTAAADTAISRFAAGASQAPEPVFSPAAGSYVGSQTVAITSPVGGTIYYTLDGTPPTESSSSISSGGTITVSASETVKAIASASDFFDSPVASAEYTIMEGNAYDSTKPFIGSIRVAGSAPAGEPNEFIGTFRIITSAPNGLPNPYLGNVTVGTPSSNDTNPFLGQAVIVDSAPSGDPDDYLGQIEEE